MRTSRSTVKRTLKRNRFQCRSRKARYRDKKEITGVLHRLEIKRRYQLMDGGVSSRNEIRGYECPDCRGFHSTSQPASAQYMRRAI